MNLAGLIPCCNYILPTFLHRDHLPMPLLYLTGRLSKLLRAVHTHFCKYILNYIHKFVMYSEFAFCILTCTVIL